MYPLSAIRYFASSEPTITSATAVGHALDASRVDRAMHATFALPHDVTGELHCDFALPGWGPFGLLPHLPKMGVTIALEGGTLEYYGFPLPHLRSYVTVRPKRGQARTESVYKHPDGTGEGWWSSCVPSTASDMCQQLMRCVQLSLPARGVRGQGSWCAAADVAGRAGAGVATQRCWDDL